MILFSRLIDALVFMPSRNGKIRLLIDYFSTAPDPDRGWALAALTEKLDLPTAKPARVRDIIWSARFRIHHGVAAHYRAGRALLAGDAAHVHSPAGGQGMNIGIQDAVGLGDRLAEVLAGRQPDAWLDGYEKQRRPVAEQVVALTDRMTRVGTMTSPAGQFVRNLMLRAVDHLPPARARIAAQMAELGPVAG